MPEPVPVPVDPAPHVVLVGLMGSGKTTVGRKLARLISRPFVDGDAELELTSGRSVAEWFVDGEEAFRRVERDVLVSLLATTEPLVIGAGGGVVVCAENRATLAGTGVTVVYLHGEPGFLATRAQAKAHRPLLADTDPFVIFDRLYSERDQWYREVAEAVVEVRPAHEAGERPKWRLAEQVAEVLRDLGVTDRSQVAGAEALTADVDAVGPKS